MQSEIRLAKTQMSGTLTKRGETGKPLMFSLILDKHFALSDLELHCPQAEV